MTRGIVHPRGCGIALLVAGASLLAGFGPLQAQEPDAPLSEDARLLLEVLIEDVAFDLVDGFRMEDGRVVVGLRPVLDLARLRIGSVEPGVRVVAFRPDQSLIEVSTEDGRITRGSETFALEAGASTWQADELYVDADVLVRLLDVDVGVDEASQTVLITSASDLPVVARAERLRTARLSLSRQQAIRSYSDVMPAGSRLLGAGVVDWNVRVTNTSPNLGETFTSDFVDGSLAAGFGLVGGSAVLRNRTNWTPTGGARSFTDFSWFRAWPDQPWLKQLRVGRVVGVGPRLRQITGVALTNAPYVRPAAFGDRALRGDVPPGWELELYQSGQLLADGVADDQGRYDFGVPIRFGRNPMTVRAFGPYGEIREFERNFEVPFERLPTGQVEYGLHLGNCRWTSCDFDGNADVRWGARDWLTVRGGTEVFGYPNGESSTYPYVGTAVQPFQSLALSGEYVADAQASARATFALTSRFRAGAAYIRPLGDTTTVLPGRRQGGDYWNGFLFLRPGGDGGRVFFRLDGRRSTSTTFRRQSTRLTVSAQLAALRLDAGGRYEDIAGTSLALESNYLFAFASVPLGRRLAPLDRAVVRARVEYGTRGLRVASGEILKSFGGYQIDFAAGWDEYLSSFVSLRFRASVQGLRFLTRNRVDDLGVSSVSGAEGTVAFGASGAAFTVADGRGVDRAGVSGVAFLDENGDGRLSEGEERLEGLRLRVGPTVVETDEDGSYHTWDLIPYEFAYIELLPGSRVDPQYEPLDGRLRLRPDPNRFVRVDIPFVRTRELSGEVRLAPDDVVVGGLTVVIESVDGGASYTATTFSDGGFYTMGVRPGRYRVSLAPEIQESTGLLPEAVIVDVGTDGRLEVDGVTLQVRRR